MKSNELANFWDENLRRQDTQSHRSFLDNMVLRTQGLNLPNDSTHIPLRPMIIPKRLSEELRVVSKKALALSEEALNRWTDNNPLSFLSAAGLAQESRIFMSHKRRAIHSIQKVARPDILMCKGQVKVLELNAHTAIGGLPECSALGRIYLQQKACETLRDRFPLYAKNPIIAMASYLKEMAKDLGIQGRPLRVALIEWDYDSEMNHHYAAMLSQSGIAAVYIHPDKIEERAGYLASGIIQFDIALRNVSLEAWKFPDDLSFVTSYVRGCQFGGTLILSDERSTLISNKCLFAYMHEFKTFFALDKQEFIDKYIPWTAQLKDQNVIFESEIVGLKNLLQPGRRHRFVLKKGQGEGGDGVFVGKGTSEREWENAVDTAFNSTGWVVQEFIPGDLVTLPYLNAKNELDFQTTPYLLGQYIIGDQHCDPLVRLDRSLAQDVINHAKGATVSVALESL